MKFPYVLKVDSPDVIHKADEGGVALGIRDMGALIAALETMQRRFARRKVSYVLQEQKPAGREIIVGGAACPDLGSLVIFGLGGVFVEVMKDVSFSLAPLGPAEARAMMKDVKGYRVLEGVRGEAGVDLAAVEDVLCRVSRLLADFPNIVEMDLNPLVEARSILDLAGVWLAAAPAATGCARRIVGSRWSGWKMDGAVTATR